LILAFWGVCWGLQERAADCWLHRALSSPATTQAVAFFSAFSPTPSPPHPPTHSTKHNHRSGSVCLDVINQTWSPMFDLINVFEVFLPQLLLYPNPTDPLNGEAAALLMREPNTYNTRVKGAWPCFGVVCFGVYVVYAIEAGGGFHFVGCSSKKQRQVFCFCRALITFHTTTTNTNTTTNLTDYVRRYAAAAAKQQQDPKPLSRTKSTKSSKGSEDDTVAPDSRACDTNANTQPVNAAQDEGGAEGDEGDESEGGFLSSSEEEDD